MIKLLFNKNSQLFCKLQVFHELYRHPLRRCSCLLAAALPPSSQEIGLRLPALLLLDVLAFDAGRLRRHGSRSGGYSEQPPTNRTAYVAWAEWSRFGRSTVVWGGSANGYVNRNGYSERSEPLSSRVGDYWGSCGHPEWNGNTSGRPWSGAFVAWVMSHSGVSAARFPRVGRHGSYLASLFDHERAGSTAFLLHGPPNIRPSPATSCAPVRPAPTWRYSDPRTARRRIDATANHCDVVAYVRSGYVYAIGGNVKDSVTMSLYPADGRGRLLSGPAPVDDGRREPRELDRALAGAGARAPPPPPPPTAVRLRRAAGQQQTHGGGLQSFAWLRDWSAARSWLLHEVGDALGDHDGGRVGVAADQGRHHRGVDHAQALDAAHAAAAVDHRHRIVVRAHLAGADRVVDRLALGADPLLDLGVGLHRRAGLDLVGAIGIEADWAKISRPIFTPSISVSRSRRSAR